MTVTFDHGGNIFTVARNLGIPPERLLDFSASINPLGVGERVRNALRASMDQLVHYPDTDAVELARALAEHHGLHPACICGANGSTELIYLLPRLLAGTRALIVAPAFSEYAKALSAAGWEIAYHELQVEDDFHLSVAKLEARLAEGYDALFVCNPGNPTGNLIPLPVITEIQSICCKTATFFVLDEAFMDFCEAGSAKRCLAQGGGIVLRSMTKFFGIPGLRLGYAIGSPDIIGRVSALQGPWTVSTPAQMAGIAALEDHEYHLQTMELIYRERDFLTTGLRGIPGFKVYPSAANYLLAQISSHTGFTATELRERLLSLGVLIRDCSNFVGLDSRFFRVAVRSRLENEQLLRKLESAAK